MGVQEKRLEGAEYYEMVDEFMQAIYNRYPDVLVNLKTFLLTRLEPCLQSTGRSIYASMTISRVLGQ